MNNKIKYVLIGFLFTAVVGAAYTAGIYSQDKSDFPASGQMKHPVETPRTTGADQQSRATGSDAEKRDQVSGSPAVPATTDATAKRDRINLEDYETLDNRHSDIPVFRPDPYVLKEKFPDNRALPPATREEFIEKQKQREERNREYGMIAANKASPAEIEAYYSEQAELAKDSIEILLFILTEYRDQMSETDLLKHEFLVERFQKRLELIPERKADALQRLKNP